MPHRGNRILVDALVASGVTMGSQRIPLAQLTAVPNMFACEALATAYRWSPERNDKSPLAQQALDQLSAKARENHQDSRIAYMLDLSETDPGRFDALTGQAGESIGLALGPVATVVDPIMTVASGFLANEAFRDALAAALLKAGQRPCKAGSVVVTDPDDTLFLAAKGAALVQMRNRAWRRWPGYVSLGQPPELDVATSAAIKTNLAREAAWITY